MRMTRKRRKARDRQQRAEQNIKNVISKSAYLAVAGIIAVQSGGIGQVYAMPQGGQVAAGQAGIHQAGQTMTIAQQTAQAIINWRSFGILPNEHVNFLQPGANSVMLNRVLGNDPSAIYGKLTANGKVFLVNPNGVFFAPGAQVSVGGLVATTLSITDADFMNGKYQFKNDGKAGSVVNQGTITAGERGLVALLAPEVKNEGIIAAKKGTVALAAGDQMTLDYAGDGKIQLAVTEGAFKAAAENKGLLEADGGIVLMTARGNQDVASSVVNQSGIIRARSLDGKTGEVTLDAGQGSVNITGTVDVTGTNAHRGGTFNAYGKDITLAGAAAIDASGEAGGGTVRIGGDWQGKGDAPHADNVTMEKGAVIHADATKNGDGGKVVLWSDGTTKFAGEITAKGGAAGGDGGMVETSGKVLQANGNVNASALRGNAGEWLLDPGNITIGSSGNTLNPDNSYTGGSADSIVDVGSIENALNNSTGSTNVKIKTGADGNITVDAAITKSQGGEASLTLDAGGSINVNKAIVSTADKLNVNLLADNDGKGGGSINVANNITTNGGSVTLCGGVGGTGYASGTGPSEAGVTVTGAINAGAGDITIAGESSQSNGVDITGTLSSGGAVTIEGKGISTTKDLSLGTVSAKNLTLIGDSMAFNGAITGASDGAATIKRRTADGAISVGSSASNGLALKDIGKLTGFGAYQIGDQNTSAITVDGTATFGGNTTLETTGGVTVNGALNAGANNVTLKAGAASGGVGVVTAGTLDLQGNTAAFTFSGANKVNALTGNVKNVTFKNDQAFSVGAAGLKSAGDKIDLTANGALTIDGAVASGNGAVNLTANQLTLNQGVNSGSGDITLNIDGISGTGVVDGLIKGTGKLTIDRKTSGEISLGGTSGNGLHIGSTAFGSGNTLFGSTFNKGVFIGGANTSTMSVNGALEVGNELTVTSQGAMNFAANGEVKTSGDKNLKLNAANIAFNGSNTIGAGKGTLTVNTDQITDWGNLAFDGANNGSLVIAPKTSNTAIEIGGSTETGKLAVTAAGLAAIKNGNFKNVQIGQGDANGVNKGTGAVTLYGFTQPAANFTINGGAGTFVSGTMQNNASPKETLTLNLDSLTQAAGSVFDIGGNLVLNGTGAFNLNSTSNKNFGSLTAKNVGDLDVYSQSLGLNGVESTGNITLITDNITNVLGNVKTTGGDILIKTITGNKNITIGGNKVAGDMWLNAAWMKNFDTSGKLMIGDKTNYIGKITVTDTTFGSAVDFLTSKGQNGGNVAFNGNVYAGAAGDKDIWIYTWSWAWTGAAVHVKDLHLDIGQGLSGGGKVQSNGGKVYFTQPANTDIYITNSGNDVLSGGYQIAYDFLNGMTGFGNFAIEGDKDIYMFGNADASKPELQQSVNIKSTSADVNKGVIIKGQVDIGGQAKDVTIEGAKLTMENGAGITSGTANLTLTTDVLDQQSGAGKIIGDGGNLVIQQKTANRELSIGSTGNGLHFTQDQLNGDLFDGTFSSLTLGSAGGGDVTTDAALAINNNITIQAGKNAEIKLGGDLTIGDDSKTYKVTLKGGWINNQNHAINANAGTLNLYADDFSKLTGAGNVTGAGILGIGAYDDNGAISLGDVNHGGLWLENKFFTATGGVNPVFAGFDSYKIGNGGVGQTITVDKASLVKNTILDANAVTFKGDGMTMGSGTTLTLKAKNVTQDDNANLNIANLALQGSDASTVNLLNADNVIGGTVSGDGHTIQVAAKALNVGKITGKGNDTGLIELASDNITFSGGAGSVSGAGELYVHQNSGKELHLGTAAAGFSGLTLGQGGAFDKFGTGFKYVSLGNKDGKGRVTFGGALNFANNTTVYGNWIAFITGVSVTTANKWLTFDATNFQMQSGSSIDTGTGALTLTTDNLDLKDGSKIYGTGDLLLQTKKTDGNLYLGEWAGGNIDAGKGLILQSHYFNENATNRVFMDRGSANIIIGNANHTGTLTQAGSTQFTDNVIIRQAANNTSGGYSASGVINTGGAHFTVESQNATFTNADVRTGGGKISIKTDNLTMNGTNSFTGTGGLWLDTYTQGKEITIGSGGSGLNLDSSWFGANGVFSGVTNGINIGSSATGKIEVNTALDAGGNTLTLTSKGTIGGSGAITAQDTVIKGNTGVNLSGAIITGKMTADSANGAIQLTGNNNTIVELGDITAKKNVEINNAGALTITGTVTGTKDGAKDAVKIKLDKGNLTIGSSGTVVSNSGNITLIAGSDKDHKGHFINDSGSDALKLNGGGRWLVYTYDSLGDQFGGLTGDFRKYGAQNGVGDPLLSGAAGNGSAHFYKPKVTIYAEKTYGEGNTQFFDNGTFKLIVEGGQAREDADKAFLGVNELLKDQTASNSYSYGSSITANNGKYLGVNKNVGGSGLDGTAYGTAYDTGTGMQGNEIAYKQDQNHMNYDISVEFWVNPKKVTVTASNDNKTYDGVQYSGGNNVSYNGFEGSDSYTSGGVTYGGTSQGAKNAGSYDIDLSGDLYANNYYFDYVDGALTIDKKKVTVSASGAEMEYNGGKNYTGGGLTYTGFVTGENVANAGVSGFDNLNTSITKDGSGYNDVLNAGSYGLTINGGLDAANYDFEYVAGNLTVNKKKVTVTANNDNKTYDGMQYGGNNGVSYEGFVTGEGKDKITGGNVQYGGNAQGALNAGSYDIGLGGNLTADNYDFIYKDGNLTVNKKKVTVTANDDNKTYDGAQYGGNNGVSYDGFVTGEGKDKITGGNVQYGGNSQGALNAGSYDIGLGGNLTADNYDFIYKDGNLTVEKKKVTVTANNDNKTYDGMQYGGGNDVSYDGFVTGEGKDKITGGNVQYGGNAQGALNAGSYDIGLGGNLTADNYDFIYKDGDLTVEKKKVTVTANNDNKTYDGMQYGGNNGVSYDGFVTGEGTDKITGGNVQYGGNAQGALNAGSYDIDLNGSSLTADNYDFIYKDGNLTVEKKKVTVTANNDNKTYDGMQYGGGNDVSYEGFVTGEGKDKITGGNVQYGGNAQGALNAGSYDIGLGGNLTADNYDFIYKDGNLTVEKKKVTIGANGDVIDFGQLGSNGYQGNTSNPNGTLNGTFGNGWGNPNGLVGGQTIVWDAAQGKFIATGVDGFTGGINGYTGDSQGALAPGEYNLGLTGDLYADNYVFTYMPGHLTITDVDGSYVPPKPPEPPNPTPAPRPDKGIADAVGTVNSVMKAQPFDSSAEKLSNTSSRLRMMPSLISDIDPNVPALNIEGMVSVVDVAAAVDFPQGDVDVKAQGRSVSIRLYADRSGFGMLLGGIEGDYSPESSRTDGAIPVLYTDYSSVGTEEEQALDGFYDVVYTPERLSIEPKAQGETVPLRSEIKPELRQDYAVTYKDARIGDFRVAFGNGILTVHPQDQKAVDTITNAQKPAQRAVLTAGVLRAIQDFGVTPDQLRAIYLFREKQVMKAQARKG